MRLLLIVFLLFSINTLAQQPEALSIFDARAWGIVLDHPDMKKVTISPDVTFLSDSRGTLKMDVYLPLAIGTGELRPAIIFLNAIGERAGQPKLKSWGTYRTWPQLIAANGYVGISMENDNERIQDGLIALFKFLNENGKRYHVDASKLGVYAASANVTQSLVYLMGPHADPGIKAAVLYYGGTGTGPYRKDLPVYFVIAESDVARGGYANLWAEVLKNRAPWSIVMGSGLVHAFDSFNDTEDSRKMIKSTLAFWKTNIEPAPSHPWPNSIGRETLAAWFGHDNEKAAAILKPWIESHPDDLEALRGYGHTLKDLQRFAEADEIYKRVLARDPNDIHLLEDRITIKYGVHQPEEARRLVAEFEKSGQASRNFYSSLGLALYIQNNHEEGVQYFRKAIDLNGLEIDYYNLACGLAILHKADGAFEALDHAIAKGFQSKDQVVNDPDLESLRNDSRYQSLLARLH